MSISDNASLKGLHFFSDIYAGIFLKGIICNAKHGVCSILFFKFISNLFFDPLICIRESLLKLNLHIAEHTMSTFTSFRINLIRILGEEEIINMLICSLYYSRQHLCRFLSKISKLISNYVDFIEYRSSSG